MLASTMERIPDLLMDTEYVVWGEEPFGLRRSAAWALGPQKGRTRRDSERVCCACGPEGGEGSERTDQLRKREIRELGWCAQSATPHPSENEWLARGADESTFLTRSGTRERKGR
ncbi:hypothetical protein GGX14DRAFT_392348 [Mycena pura]|uniref:Uncharacterized protein n=1 Tax=Mycena pura TaxID=153505 RepID=A0AAD6YCW5_9AGAR|nr:hypothetical protein GGX14DRAFT_392348 [Mycena pura]